MSNHPEIDALLRGLDYRQTTLARRDRAYRGVVPLRFTADEIAGDLKAFNVNINRTAVNAVAERMRPKRLVAAVNGRDVSETAQRLYEYSRLDHHLQAAIADSLATGVAYLSVWADDHGTPRVWVESARNVWARRDANGRVVEAVKRWFDVDEQGLVGDEHVIHYTPKQTVRYLRGGNNTLEPVGEPVDNPFNVVPIFPVVNSERVDDTEGISVLDDLEPLTAALSKVVSDMIVTSEATARPRRYATGIPLEEGDDIGFSADGGPTLEPVNNTPVKAPFSDGQDMFVTEATEAKFGTLPGSDLGAYQTAVNVLVSQIEAVSGLPGHLLGVQTANPASADAIRAAEASLTARAESRIRVLGAPIEDALQLLVALEHETDVRDVDVRIRWASPATRSFAQEADGVTKLFTIGVIDRDEARDMLGLEAK